MRPHTTHALTLVAALAAPLPAQESRALFDAPLVVADDQTRFALLLDYDQDGFEDALGYWWADDTGAELELRVWINDGAGRLVPTWSAGIAGSWPGGGTGAQVSFWPADFDGDPHPDFFGIFTHDDRGSLLAWRGNPAGNPTTPILLSWHDHDQPIRGAVFADFTGDGQPDRAMLRGERLMIHRLVDNGDGSGNGIVTANLQIGPGLDFIALADCDGDAVPDLLVHQDRFVHLFAMSAAGTPTLLGTWQHGPVAMSMPTFDDVDGDGDRDFVLFDVTEYTLLRRTGPAGFSPEPALLGGPATHLVDVDGDGDLDGLCCGGGGGWTPDPAVNDQPSIFRVSINDGAGAFAPAIELPGLGSVRAAGAADLDHDGDVELVAGRCVYYPPAPIAGPRPAAFAAPQAPRTVADLDGDGDPDLECGLGGALRNLGDGTLADFAPFVEPPPAGAAYAGPGFPGDFDGDGDVDLVVGLDPVGGGARLSMRLLRNNGGGGFLDGGDASAPGVDFNLAADGADTPEASLAADCDGDGDLDLVWRTVRSPAQSKVWWNDGAGHFSDGPYFQGEVVHHVADFDADGAPDLVVAREQLQIRWGDGAGGFGPRTGAHGALDPHLDRSAVADLDGDGDLDLGCTHRYLASGYTGFQVWAYHVDRTFTQLPLLTELDEHGVLDGWPRFVRAIDATGDGRLDLLVGPRVKAPSCATLIPRASNGAGWAPYAQWYEQALFDVTDDQVLLELPTPCDLDGDGDVDLATNRPTPSRLHEPPLGGARRQTGAGAPAADGVTPVLGASGPFRLGETVHMRVTGAPPQTPGVLLASTVDVAAPFAGGPRLGAAQAPVTHRIHFQTTGDPQEPGGGAWSLVYSVPAYKVGHTVRYEALLVDPATGAKSVATNALELTYGP